MALNNDNNDFLKQYNISSDEEIESMNKLVDNIAEGLERINKNLCLEKNETVQADEVISKDQTLNNIMSLIMSAKSVDEAKEVFFNNLITLMKCKEVCEFFNQEYIDEEGKRYTIGRDGRKYCFTSDLIEKILDEEFGEETTKHEEETAWGVTFEEFQKIYEENNGFDVRYPKNNSPIVSDSNNQNFVKANEIIISEPDMSILEGTMFHEVDDLNENQNIRTRKDNNK